MNNPSIYTPRIIENFETIGFADNFTLPGDDCHVIGRASLTSYDTRFNVFAGNIASMVGCNQSSLNRLLVLVGKDNVAKVYEDFPMSMQIVAKRDIKAGTAVFDSDIADITEISFSDAVASLSPEDEDKIIWIFREGFTFGMYFDLTGKLIKENLPGELAHTFLQVRYFNLYRTLSDESTKKLLEYGWFPFTQLLGKDFEAIHSLIKQGKFDRIAGWLEDAYSNERIEKFTNGWWSNKHFSEKENILKEGLGCFYNKQYSACISTLTPMVEGIANSYYHQTTGKGIGYSGGSIAKAISDISMSKFSPSSLTFPSLFKAYLESYFFKNTKSSVSDDNVRNTVSHGRASQQSFTHENSLKLILTLDQMRFYMAS